MDSIKTEPATNGEMYTASHSDRQHIDTEVELKYLLVRFSQMKIFMCRTYSEFVFFVVILTVIMREVCAKIGTPLDCGTVW